MTTEYRVVPVELLERVLKNDPNAERDAMLELRSIITARAGGPKRKTTPTIINTDCRSDVGVTVGLVDSIITMARVLSKRDLDCTEAREALKDLAGDEDLLSIIKATPAAKDAFNCIDGGHCGTGGYCDACPHVAKDGESIGGKCWSCKEPVKLIEWVEFDGHCPHCDAEIDEAEGLRP
jgi:hypothetical protein